MKHQWKGDPTITARSVHKWFPPKRKESALSVGALVIFFSFLIFPSFYSLFSNLYTLQHTLFNRWHCWVRFVVVLARRHTPCTQPRCSCHSHSLVLSFFSSLLHLPTSTSFFLPFISDFIAEFFPLRLINQTFYSHPVDYSNYHLDRSSEETDSRRPNLVSPSLFVSLKSDFIDQT